MKKVESGIYCIENLVNGKKYIGQSCNLDWRWYDHKRRLIKQRHDNKHLQASCNKYGIDNFKFDIIEYCDEDKLNEREIYWISYYNTYLGDGYNQTLGGEGTRKVHTILQFDLNGNLIKEWDNGRIASQELNINATGIYGCCTHKYKSAGGYIWIYKEDYNDKDDLEWYFNKNNHNNCNVIQYDLYGREIKIWNNIAEIKNILGYNVIYCCLHTTYTSHGFIWKYCDDDFEINDEYCYYARNSLKLLNSKPFNQIDKNCNIVKHYNCLNEAVRDGYTERLVNECCRGLRDQYKGFLWVYDEELENIDKEYCDRIFNKKIEPMYYTILQYDLNNNFIKEYEYLAMVENDGFKNSNVRDCCFGRKKQYKGYIWRIGKYIEHPHCNEVLQYDLDGNLIKSFYSLNHASESTGINECSIGACCNNRIMSTHGFIFKYKRDNIVIDNCYCRLTREKSKMYKIIVINFKTMETFIYEHNPFQKNEEYDIQEILKCVRGKKEFYKGKVWINYYDYINMSKEEIESKIKLAFDLNDNRIICLNTKIIFNTCKEAGEYYNIKPCNISSAICHRNGQAGRLKDTGEKLYWMKYKDYLKLNNKNNNEGLVN